MGTVVALKTFSCLKHSSSIHETFRPNIQFTGILEAEQQAEPPTKRQPDTQTAEHSAGPEAWRISYLCCVTNCHQLHSLKQHILAVPRLEDRVKLSLVSCLGSHASEISISRAGFPPGPLEKIRLQAHPVGWIQLLAAVGLRFPFPAGCWLLSP